MTILQIGVAKSGNLWLYRILQHLLDLRGEEHRSYITTHPIHAEAQGWNLSGGQADIDSVRVSDAGVHCVISSAFQEPIPDMEAYVSQCRHIWTHSPWSSTMGRLAGMCRPSVYIIRDPRNVAISMSRFAFSPYFLRFHPHRERTPEEFLRHRLYGMVLSWIDHVAGYLRHQEDHDLHVVFYESLTSDFDREVARLGERVGVDLSESKLEELKRAVSFSQMKKDSPQHLNSGARTDWRAVLSPTQDRIVADVAGPILDLLGYPVSGSDPVSEPGQFGEDLTAAALDDAIDRCGGTLASKAAYAGSFLTSRRSTREKLAKGLRFIRGAQVRR